MRQVIISVICFLLVSISVHAEMDPKIKASIAMTTYGAVGGALLGTASLAFGTTGRAVAKGASIGLYLGIIFAGYVIISYKMRIEESMNPETKPNYYPDSVGSPYEQLSPLNSGDNIPYGMNINPSELQNQNDKTNDILLYIPIVNIFF